MLCPKTISKEKYSTMKKLLILGLIALSPLVAFASNPYPDWIIREAHKNGYSTKDIEFCAQLHCVWDNATKSFVGGAGVTQSNASEVSRKIDRATQQSSWTYMYPDFNYFGYRDGNGVLHSFRAEQARYNPSTKDYQVQIHGRWLSVGRDIFQLTDFN
jgi:hypothetical protein